MNIKDLNKKYAVFAYILGTGKFDSLFGIDLISNKKEHEVEAPMKLKVFLLSDGIIKAISEYKMINTCASLNNKETNVIMDFYIRNGGNKDIISLEI